MENTRSLTRKVNARALGKTEVFKIVFKGGSRDKLTYRYKRGVAGVLYCNRKILRAVARMLPASYTSVCNHLISGALEGGIKVYNVLLNRHGGCENFKGRTRLVGINDKLVSAHKIYKFGFLFLDCRIALFGGSVVCKLF